MKLIPDAAMVFGGVLPYVPQYAQIKQTKSTGSFSTHVRSFVHPLGNLSRRLQPYSCWTTFSSEHMIKNLIKVCLVLLLANSMRIFFRYGKVYEDALLLQSLIMIIAMIVLTELCVRTNRFKSTKQHRIAVFTEVLVRRDSMTISVFRVSCPDFQIFRHVIDTKCRRHGFSPNNRL